MWGSGSTTGSFPFKRVNCYGHINLTPSAISLLNTTFILISIISPLALKTTTINVTKQPTHYCFTIIHNMCFYPESLSITTWKSKTIISHAIIISNTPSIIPSIIYKRLINISQSGCSSWSGSYKQTRPSLTAPISAWTDTLIDTDHSINLQVWANTPDLTERRWSQTRDQCLPEISK